VDDPQFPGHDPRYAGLSASELPLTECLKDTVARFLPYWHDAIAPAIRGGQRVIVAAHGNSLRAVVKYLDGISDEDIVELNIPTGIPLIYELDAGLKPIRHCRRSGRRQKGGRRGQAGRGWGWGRGWGCRALPKSLRRRSRPRRARAPYTIGSPAGAAPRRAVRPRHDDMDFSLR
jgi:hypothetical protein